MASSRMSRPQILPIVDVNKHKFIVPQKRINEGQDVQAFLCSRAYTDLGRFITQLNTAMCPKSQPDSSSISTWEIDSPAIEMPPPVQAIHQMLQRINALIGDVPPDPGPRRFGNISFQKWHTLMEDQLPSVLEECLPESILSLKSESPKVIDELLPYLSGSFGSAQRLDYGTGHELSFLAFLGCVWKLGGFHGQTQILQDGALERSLVLGIIEPYLRVVRRLILTYTLEPAGSHGVWGLDDHFFLSYIFGSAQYCPPIQNGEAMPVEGSLANVPSPAEVINKNVVARERATNMYFSAVGFIYDVKTGPFWEHSPILYDISGVRAGWGKVNKGMIKMYNAEVLSKFPVVQHFPFGSLFSFERDPNAPRPQASIHADSQPSSTISVSGNTKGEPTGRLSQHDVTKAPWSTSEPPTRSVEHHSINMPATAAPWAKSMMPPTTAPWAKKSAPVASTRDLPRTHAPWASEAPQIGSSTPRVSQPDSHDEDG